MTIKLYGAALSPFVRKTRVVLALKGVDYQSVHVDPTNIPEGYEKISPMKRIPALEIDGQYLADSAAICAFAEQRWPEPALYPSDPMEHARAIWLQRYADYDLAVLTTFVVFRNRFLMPLLGKPGNEEKVRKALDEGLPPLFRYLDEQLVGKDWLCGDQLSIADIAVASQLVNFSHGGEQLDTGRYPNLAAHAQRLHALPPFAKSIAKERAFVEQVRANRS